MELFRQLDFRQTDKQTDRQTDGLTELFLKSLSRLKILSNHMTSLSEYFQNITTLLQHFNVQCTNSNVQCLNSNIQCPKSILQCLMSCQLNFLTIPSLLELDSEAAPSCYNFKGYHLEIRETFQTEN